MTGAKYRLLSAGLLALILHGVALSWQLRQDAQTLPTLLPAQQISVTLGIKEIVREQAPEAKQIKHRQKIKEVLPQAKQPAKVFKQFVQKKPADLPVNRPRAVVRKTMEKNPQPEPTSQQTTSTQKKQSITKATTPAAAHIIQQATPLYRINPTPKYPRMAKRRGLEGVVLLKALIGISGKVAEIRVFTSSGHNVLDRAAMDAVRCWRFIPGTVGAERQAMWVKVPIRFKLQ